jgi:hypothetical protein
VVLHEPEIVESHLVGQFALVQSFPVQGVPVNLSAFVRALHLKKQSEFHAVAPSVFLTGGLVSLGEYIASHRKLV